VRKNLYLLVIVILNQLNILFKKMTKIILRKNITKTEKPCEKKHCSNPQ